MTLTSQTVVVFGRRLSHARIINDAEDRITPIVMIDQSNSPLYDLTLLNVLFNHLRSLAPLIIKLLALLFPPQLPFASSRCRQPHNRSARHTISETPYRRHYRRHYRHWGVPLRSSELRHDILDGALRKPFRPAEAESEVLAYLKQQVMEKHGQNNYFGSDGDSYWMPMGG